MDEATASFLGISTLWWPEAVHPTYCTSVGHCFTGSPPVPLSYADLEHTSYPYDTDNCSKAAANPESRWPVSGMRFLWDLYDTTNDCLGDTIQDGWDCLECFWEVRTKYPDGVNAYQWEEPWTDTRYILHDNWDGRGMSSYEYNYRAAYSRASAVLWVDNCSPK